MEIAEAVPRERGWRRLIPVIALFLFVPAVPQLRAAFPIEQTLMLLVPALTVCAWVGWRHGGQLWMAVGCTVLAAWLVARPLAGGAQYAGFARGWALLLAAAFGAVSLWRSDRPFFPRVLWTLGMAGLLFAAGLAAYGAGPRRVERVVAAELSDRVESSIASLRSQMSGPNWEELERTNPDGAASLAQMFSAAEAQLRALAPIGTALFPALLAFESIVALGLAWSLFHRLSRARIGPPIARLREFRFDDQLVWGVIAGLVIVLLPSALGAWKGVGLNLLAFFGVLYALRGLGVMMWFLIAPGRWLGFLLLAMVALIWPLWSVPLGIGLGDTWLDWRRRARASTSGSVP